MISRTMALTACALLILALTGSVSMGQDKEPLKSGPQVEASNGGHFDPLMINGKQAGQRSSMVWQVRGYYEPRPYLIIFVRGTDEPTIKLIQKLDEEQARSKTFRVGVVFLSDDPKITEALQKLVEKEKIRAATVSVHDPTGPKAWKISNDAAITAVLSNTRQRVVANFAFRKGELDGKSIDNMVEVTIKLSKKE
jgi:hypothetical protein